MRQVKVRGTYAGLTGVMTYTGPSTTVPEKELVDNPGKQQRVDDAAAKRASENFFFRRAYEQLDYTVEEVRDINTNYHSTDEFEDLGNTDGIDDAEDEDD